MTGIEFVKEIARGMGLKISDKYAETVLWRGLNYPFTPTTTVGDIEEFYRKQIEDFLLKETEQ